MKRAILFLAALGSAALLSAAPASKADPVAEGYPDWQGLTPKNYIRGREITASDLRHRIAVVVNVEAGASLQSQLLRLGDRLAVIDGIGGFHAGDNWETLELPRDVIVLISIHGVKDAEAVQNAFKRPKDCNEELTRKFANITGVSIPVYGDVTFTGAPDLAGKMPYVYVMGTEGTTPVWQGPLDAGADKLASAAVNKEKKKMKDGGFAWTPFFGTVAEPKFYPTLAKTIEKGKPLQQVLKSLLRDVTSKDAEKAKEAQILYDAINQARGDLLMRIKLEYAECPHRAIYDMKQLVKFWPSEKKKLDFVTAKVKANPEAGKLAQILEKIMPWANPNFTCKSEGEAKQIVAQLTKMKKDLEKMKESKNVIAQNGAQIIDSQLDDLIAIIPTRVAAK